MLTACVELLSPSPLPSPIGRGRNFGAPIDGDEQSAQCGDRFVLSCPFVCRHSPCRVFDHVHCPRPTGCAPHLTRKGRSPPTPPFSTIPLCFRTQNLARAISTRVSRRDRSG